MTPPVRGEIWLADLGAAAGHEPAGQRPVLIISEDLFNRGPAGVVIALPLTSTVRPVPTRVRISPPEGGLRTESDVVCDGVRSISKERLLKRWGIVRSQTLAGVEDRLRILMRL